MSRKFNIGRQNDLLLNEKMHDLYTHLEFINYKDGDGNIITMPRQTKQTAIPTGALWLQHPFDSNTHKLRVHTDPTAANIEDRWPCLFEGYYHPASLTGQEPENPVHGQIWINDQNVLFVRDNSGVTPRWNPVATKVIIEEDSGYFVGMDYQSIDPLLPLDMGGDYTGDPIYSVPFESFGKFYIAKNHEDEYIYCHPPVNESLQVTPYYDMQGNEGAISITDDKTEAYKAKKWVHINPYNLNKVTKRLIKINKPKTYYKKVEANKVRDREEIEVDQILLVVADNISLNELDPDTMIKARLANKNKYNQSIDFVPGDYVQPIIVTDQNTGFVPVPAGTTEYFAFKSSALNSFDEYDNRIGRLLKCYSIKEGIEDPSMGSKDKVNETTPSQYEENLDLRTDYEIKNGGILLDKKIIEEYDYIYAVSYEFKPQHTVDGNLIRITKTSLEGPDQIYIGACSGVPVVFMDGLYLEHYNDNGSSVYVYNNENITFAGNDVLDNMQILVVSFPQVNTFYDTNGLPQPQEYTISAANIVNRYDVCESGAEGALRVVQTPINSSTISYDTVVTKTPDLKGVIDNSGNYYVRESEQRDAVIQGSLINGKWDSLFDKENFPNPLIFYNGLAGYTYAAFPKDEIQDGEVDIHIDYEGKNITIHNFGPICDSNGMSAIFAVSLGENNYKNNGILEGGVIYDENIKVDIPYLVIVDGIVMSPYNEDITVEDGKITITDASIALDSEYTVIQLTDINEDLIDDTDAIICIYDDMFTPYSIPIMNPKAMNTSNAYDDCDSAVVMCGPGALVDREAIQREFDASDSFVGGQIVRKRLKSVTDDEIYEWRIYTYANEYTILDPIEDAITIADCERMITYYMNKGTVLLNPVNIDDQPVTVYAYTYVDHVDERLLRGQRLIPIEVPNHSQNAAGYTTYTTNRTHLYDVGGNTLSTYINGIMVPHTEEPTTDSKGDIFYVDAQFSNKLINDFGDDIYSVLMAIDFDQNPTIETRIDVPTFYGTTDASLIMKYFNSEHQLSQAKALKNYILNDMRNNSFMYIIENIEADESAACRRQWNAPRNDNGNLPNSYTTTMRLTPGIINIYVNGVLLEKDDYAIFDTNKVMIGFDLVGGQEILKKIKDQYKHPYRVLTEEVFKYIDCEADDEVLIEVRDDLTVKKRSYPIEDVSYETYTFDTIDYDFPASLCTTKDVIKIYINGVLYDGDYTNNDGVITLLECDLEEDPLYKHLRMSPSLMKEYEEKYGEYIKHEDIITFEWR